MEVPQTLKTELPHDPVIPLLGIYPEELKSESQRGTCTALFAAAFFPIAQM